MEDACQKSAAIAAYRYPCARQPRDSARARCAPPSPSAPALCPTGAHRSAPQSRRRTSPARPPPCARPVVLVVMAVSFGGGGAVGEGERGQGWSVRRRTLLSQDKGQSAGGTLCCLSSSDDMMGVAAGFVAGFVAGQGGVAVCGSKSVLAARKIDCGERKERSGRFHSPLCARARGGDDVGLREQSRSQPAAPASDPTHPPPFTSTSSSELCCLHHQSTARQHRRRQRASGSPPRGTTPAR